MEMPDVYEISGIAPAVAIRQKNSTRNPRSNVGTATEIYDYLRLLFARCGQTFCIKCGTEVRRDSPDEIATSILGLTPGRRFYVLHQFRIAAPAAAAISKRAARKSASAPPPELLRQALLALQKRGFNRLYQAGKIHEFSSPETLLEVDFSKPVYVLVDRLAVNPESRARLVDSIEVCYREGQGEAILEFIADGAGNSAERLTFNERFECKNDGILYQEPEPRLFSFNNPYGACARCEGFGNTIDFDLDLVIPNKTKTLGEGAVDPWNKPKYRPVFTEMKRFAKQENIPLDVPWEELECEQQELILDGDEKFLGVRGFFQYLERKKYKLHIRVFLSRYRGYSTCPECRGSRLRLEARQVKIEGKNICEICSMTVEDAAKFFAGVQLSPEEAEIAERLLQEIRERLRFLNDVGLEYLTLDRLSSTLSGGEAQRIQLATSLGS